MTDLAPFVALAEQLADAARSEILPRFRTGIHADVKFDRSPVTEADRESERVMRELINQTFPDHGILGEEFGSENTDAEFVWVLDPIDGTNSFVSGKPLFGTLIALCENKVPVVGLIDAPAMNERWLGAKGLPTTLNGVAASTRSCDDLDKSWLYATTPDLFEDENEAAFLRLRGKVWRTVFGGDCYAYGLLASGHVDLVCEASLGTYDFCALAPVVQGAGGIMTDWHGQSLTMDSEGRVLAAGDKNLHAKALKALGA
ncbi:MAG: histidinol-phosphatase [Rhodospirillaceae bacterium]|nr:MAG: histidinol-phosphatase [Rhodospirillaceae bacterium]